MATPRYSNFFDPFAACNVVQATDVFTDTKALTVPHIDAPPPYSLALKSVLNVVTARTPNKSTWDGSESFLTYTAQTKLNIHGQGTVIANCTQPVALLFAFATDDRNKSSLYVQVTDKSVEFGYGPSAPPGSSGFLPADRVQITGKPIGPTDNFLRPDMPYPARYWVSVDHKNGVLRFGRDYANLSMAMYEAQLKERVPPGVYHWIDEKYAFIDQLTTVTVQQSGGSFTAAPLQLVYQPLPVVQKLPPIIVPNDAVTLEQLATGSVTVPANLTPECQRLYANVAGLNIQLDTPDFPDFGLAIQHSVNTEGLLCEKLLKAKAGEFGKDSTYLRITLGADLGNSPGSPYVLEIWPAMHASPIHNHGDAHAVIKVLYGEIKAYYFTSLYEAHPVGPPANLHKGDVTWLDPNNYQVHQLSNENRDGAICCTIQCYSYGAEDSRHYEDFDYVNDKTHKVIEHFEPNSDMSFLDFKLAIREEWAKTMKQ
ncbi:hypothetical protein HMN09_00892500 [Mycena chlorophos]|uniref:Cysteine dioxygenase n=1 Tax=Mycena chlorophos TaxID=658473 RepID=A0A8H6SPD7_MYCCL|nr:hypothetical protein HMN09_00892500 [Mycena chlorophos]